MKFKVGDKVKLHPDRQETDSWEYIGIITECDINDVILGNAVLVYWDNPEPHSSILEHEDLLIHYHEPNDILKEML